MELVFFLIWGVIWGALCAWLAAEKGRDVAIWFILGFFFALIAVIVLGLSPSVETPLPAVTTPTYRPLAPAYSAQPSESRRPAALASEGTKRCPDCAEDVKVEARICRFCRYEFPAPPPGEILDVSVPAGGALPEALAPAPPHAYGGWGLESRVSGFASGAEIELSTEGTSLMLASSNFKRVLTTAKVAAVERRGLLRLNDGYQEMLLRPLDHQDPAEVAGELHGQGAPGAVG